VYRDYVKRNELHTAVFRLVRLFLEGKGTLEVIHRTRDTSATLGFSHRLGIFLQQKKNYPLPNLILRS
jgi:hypothetical protein